MGVLLMDPTIHWYLMEIAGQLLAALAAMFVMFIAYLLFMLSIFIGVYVFRYYVGPMHAEYMKGNFSGHYKGNTYK
jgi:GR25 family glycosyltransferase involved in LPS biosynthesis